jgi:type II secretory pathway component PulK
MAVKFFFQRKTKFAKRLQQQGLALIFVLSLIGTILAVLSEVLLQSQITVRASVGEREKLEAEASALAAIEFARMLVTLEVQINNLLDPANKDLSKEIREGIRGTKKGLETAIGKPIVNLLDGIPFNPDKLGAGDISEKFNLNASLDEKLLEALNAVPGSFSLKITNESAKLNLNLLEGAEKKPTFLALKRLFSLPNEARFLNEKGYAPDRLAANLQDYIDKDNIDEVDRGDESAQYSAAKFNHSPKNARLESLEELRRIPGFHDDEIFNLFSRYFTIWPLDAKEKSLNFNIAPIELLAAFFTKDGEEVNNEQIDKIEDMRHSEKELTEERELSEAIPNLDDESKSILSRIIGIQSRIYKVEATGVSGGLEKRVTVVFEPTKAPGKSSAPVNTSPPGSPPGGEQNSGNVNEVSPAPTASATDGADKSTVRVIYQRTE